MLEALGARPFAEGVPYHSIIAKAAPVAVESSTDLVVPYSSSHLDGAASELVVDGTHSCLGKPEVISEIRRILALHLREVEHDLASRRGHSDDGPEAVGTSELSRGVDRDGTD